MDGFQEPQPAQRMTPLGVFLDMALADVVLGMSRQIAATTSNYTAVTAALAAVPQNSTSAAVVMAGEEEHPGLAFPAKV